MPPRQSNDFFTKRKQKKIMLVSRPGVVAIEGSLDCRLEVTLVAHDVIVGQFSLAGVDVVGQRDGLHAFVAVWTLPHLIRRSDIPPGAGLIAGALCSVQLFAIRETVNQIWGWGQGIRPAHFLRGFGFKLHH